MSDLKLSKKQQAERDELIASLAAAKEQLIEARQSVEDAVSQYNDRVNEVNEVAASINEFCENIVSRAEEEMEGRSEKWLESDRGEAAAAWIEDWQNVSLDIMECIEVDFPDDGPDADDFEQAASEPEN